MRRGYTIVELLVVISILVLLISIASAQFAKVRASSRDARRIQDISASARVIDHTAEAYKGIFPPYTTNERISKPLCALGSASAGRSYIMDSLSSGSWPHDPLYRQSGCTSSLDPSIDYQYQPAPAGLAGSEYTLVISLERTASSDETILTMGSTNAGRTTYMLKGPNCVGSCR